MPDITTGTTVHELVVSARKTNNQPITATTFTTTIYRNGIIDTGTTVSLNLIDAAEAVFDATWSASTNGTYQLHVQNDVTTVIYISEIYNITDSGADTIVFVGV